MSALFSERGISSGRWSRSFIVLAVVAVLVLFAATQRDARLSPDSRHYIAAAANLVREAKFGPEFTSWPPLYPIVLALHDPSAGDIAPYLRALNLLCFAAFVGAFAALAVRHLQSTVLACAGIFIAACSQPIVLVYAFAWSEILYLPLSLLALFAWTARLQARGRADGRIVAGVAMGLVLLTRHVGISLAIAMGFALLATPKQTQRASVRDFAVLGVCVLPYVAWLARTFAVSGTLAGPRNYDGGSPVKEMATLGNEIARWLLPTVPIEQGGPWLLVTLAALAFILAKLLPRRPAVATLGESGERRDRAGAAGRTLGAYAASYALVLVGMGHAVSLSAFQANAVRYLAPLHPVLLLLVLIWLDGRMQHFRMRGQRIGLAAARLLAGMWFAAWLAAPNRLNDFVLMHFAGGQ